MADKQDNIPLAHIVRPKTFCDIVWQDHLVGEMGVITMMVKSNKLVSFILYGPPGCGKTTISSVLLKQFHKIQSYTFNASTDNKDTLKDMVQSLKFNKYIIIVVDEIHRMKKDIQDFLSPYIESGSIIMVGLTTENPYRTINRAIRSRCHIYTMSDITKEDIVSLLHRINIQQDYGIEDNIIHRISDASCLEIRTAINMLEMVSLVPAESRTTEHISKILDVKHIATDDGLDNYYIVLSALIKSIRGSDIDASLHYLARFLRCQDLHMITRRLMISAYEDIGLANPSVGPQVVAACEAAMSVGFPEARIPLSCAVVLLASSPKSNSAYLAIDKADTRLDELKDKSIPNHINNEAIRFSGAKYKYPHSYPNHYVPQQYLPKEAINDIYYIPQDNSKYERAIKQMWDDIGPKQKHIGVKKDQ